MEQALGAFPNGEWDSISRLLFTEDHDEGLNFAAGLWCSSGGGDEANAMTDVGVQIDESSFFASEYHNTSNYFNFSQESSTGSVFLPNQSQETSCYIGDYSYIPNISNSSSGTFDFSMLDERSICSLFSACADNVPRGLKLDAGQAGAGGVPKTRSQLKKKSDSDMPEHQSQPDDDMKIHEREPKKRLRVSKDSSNKNVQSKKSQKLAMKALNDAEDENADHSTSPYSSEDDSNSSPENSDTKVSAPINLKGKKTKASKASAAASQSIYARKRREKINERLKVLQHLVPNGTKVDISTMLEEAIHYVKFLQVQIKLLSSDDHWMYAPIAYNGMDIGLLQKMISPTS